MIMTLLSTYSHVTMRFEQYIERRIPFLSFNNSLNQSDKIMNTPFDLLRNNNKIRKQRITQQTSPTRHSFSIQSSPRALTASGTSPSRKTSEEKRIRSVRSQCNRFKLTSSHEAEQNNYQVKVKNTLKKTSNVRLTISRSGQQSNKIKISHSQRSPSSRNLQIEGVHCGRDMIKLNRQKLQELISKIEGNGTHHLSSQAIPEIVIGKYKTSKYSLLSKEHKNIKIVPFLVADQQKYSSGMETHNIFGVKESGGSQSAFLASSKTEQFDTRDFLKCNQILKKEEDEQLSNQEYSLVLDNNKVVNFIKQSKKRTNVIRNPKIQDENVENSQRNSSVFNAKNVLNFKSSLKRQVEMRISSDKWKTSFSEKKSGGKAKINGLNFKNLSGWQSPQETLDLSILNPSYLC